ncbi:SEC10/PgrA surface exclusion domain-containing protein [Lactobacillus reuteri]|nr:SEC10/PgrA surface exclusion domain-containing protein [Limosilactobacillus reuteri]
MKNHNNFDVITREYKKLYKSGKIWVAATLMTVGLAGGVAFAGTTNVHADVATPVQSAGTIQASQQATNPELANAQSDARKQQSTINSANAQLKEQQNQLSEAKDQQSSAQQELDQAKQTQRATIQNDSNVQTARAAIKDAQQKVSMAQTSVTQTTMELSEAQAQQKQAIDELNQYQNSNSQQTGFQLPDGYNRENYHKFQDALAEGNLEGRDAWDNLAGQNYMKFKYVHNARDKQESVDLEHLTNQQRIEISQFVADLLNPLRERIGAQPFVVSQGSVDLAQAIADQYNVDKVYLGHDIQGLHKVEIDNARASREAVAGLDSNINNMDDLKSAIFSSIDDMIFHDTPDWGHARTLLGLLNDTDLVNENDPVVQSYIGMSVSGDVTNGMMLHFIPTYDDVDELVGVPVHQFDKKIIKENKQDNTANIKAAQVKLNQANTDVTKAEQAKQNADERLRQAQAELITAKQSLAIAKVNANVSANQAVKDAQTKLDAINGKITDLQNAIAITNATISKAQAQLNQDNKKIADLKNAQKPVKGDDHKETITTPTKPDEGNENHRTTPTEPSTPSKDDNNEGGETSTQPTAPVKLDTGNASISGQAGHKPFKDENNGSQADNTTTEPTIFLPTTGSESNASADTHGQYINVISKDSVASQTAIQAPASTETTKISEPMTREEYKAQQAKLPQTGNENRRAVIALGVLGGMFGLGLAAKSKKTILMLK